MTTETINIYVGLQIEKIRKNRGMTQTDLASKLNISRQAVSRYEKGKRNISLETLYRLSLILNVSIELFFPVKQPI